MVPHPPSLPHENIRKIFENIYYVIGTSITHHEGHVIQHSSNMTIVRHGEELTLINTIRLDDKGLQQLDALGKAKNIVRLGAFHGQDDAFYQERYHAKLWSLKGMREDCGQGSPIKMDIEMIPGGLMPFPHATLLVFETSLYPEGILHIAQEGGILVVCDSVKNWLSTDRFFNQETAKAHQEGGHIGPANIAFWCTACNVKKSDFQKLQALPFRHILSAHGAPILNNAHEQLALSIERHYC